MLIPPLARAVTRPRSRLPLCHATRLPLYPATRLFTASPLHRKAVVANGSVAAKATPPKADPLLQEQLLTTKQQRKADWAIVKEMSRYLWPKDNMGTRLRVGLSVGLLIAAKLLNVQVPFYFKSIVDAMNIDFAAVGGTAGTVAGSMIVACKPYKPAALLLP